MTRTIDKLLVSFLLIALSFTLLVETANLIGFGSQEIYLQHPDYPEGPEYTRDLEQGKLKLFFWTITTAGLLLLAIFARSKRSVLLLNWTALLTFIAATYLPIWTISNGLITRGIVMGAVTVSLVGLIILKMVWEKHWL